MPLLVALRRSLRERATNTLPASTLVRESTARGSAAAVESFQQNPRMAATPQQIGIALGLSARGDLGPFTTYTNKNRKIVIFLKAWLKHTASPRQILHRQKLKLGNKAWNKLTREQRAAYQLTVDRLSLRMTGNNLWQHCWLTNDWPALATLVRQTGIPLHIP